MGGQTAGPNVHDIVVVAGTSASEAARGGGLKAQASVSIAYVPPRGCLALLARLACV